LIGSPAGEAVMGPATPGGRPAPPKGRFIEKSKEKKWGDRSRQRALENNQTSKKFCVE